MPGVRLSSDVEVVVAVLEAGGEVNKAVGNRTNQQPAGSEGLHSCWSAPPARGSQTQLMTAAQLPQSRRMSTAALQHKASNHAAFSRNQAAAPEGSGPASAAGTGGRRAPCGHHLQGKPGVWCWYCTSAAEHTPAGLASAPLDTGTTKTVVKTVVQQRLNP